MTPPRVGTPGPLLEKIFISLSYSEIGDSARTLSRPFGSGMPIANAFGGSARERGWTDDVDFERHLDPAFAAVSTARRRRHSGSDLGRSDDRHRGCCSASDAADARYVAGKTMRDRWDLAPAAARARGDEGNRRLHHRWVTFIDRRKRTTVANVAIARELSGWCWSLAVLDG